MLDIDYPAGKISLEELEDMCRQLVERGPEHIVVTGIPFNSKQIMNFIYNRDEKEEYRIVMVDRIGGDRSGTGDVISSIIAGMYRSSLIASMSNVRPAVEASEYLDKNNIQIIENRDNFLYMNVRRQPKSRGGGSSGGGGGSSGGGHGGSF